MGVQSASVMAKDTTILPNTTTENITDIRTIMCSIQEEYHQNLSYTVWQGWTKMQKIMKHDS